MIWEMITSTLVITLWASAFDRITQPGELLTKYMQWVANNVQNRLVNKLMTCPWCIAGQMALWFDIFCLVSFACDAWELVALTANIPASIVLVYEFSVKNRK